MRRTFWLRAVCTGDERKALENIAKAMGRKPTDALREVVRREAQNLGLWPGAGVVGGPSKNREVQCDG